MGEEGGCLGATRLNRNQQSFLAAVALMEGGDSLRLHSGPGPGAGTGAQAEGWGGRGGGASRPSLEMHYSYLALTGLVIILNHYRVWSPNF